MLPLVFLDVFEDVRELAPKIDEPAVTDSIVVATGVIVAASIVIATGIVTAASVVVAVSWPNWAC